MATTEELKKQAREEVLRESEEQFKHAVRGKLRQINQLSESLRNAKQELVGMAYVPPTLDD